ncbi:hypothetical protein ACFQFC_10785 [Amorphoplanes digitatis]|uniref:Secreted protein n=1 Tax=Actinoplanes digitatis TaxID=1868 RepID=A0A7W7I1D0_9ACTN|nr:hypothetical protein [Actinoplanes digitatis]MBB4764683.1 hypothetical protein [Actinoplanes digitatis]
MKRVITRAGVVAVVAALAPAAPAAPAAAAPVPATAIVLERSGGLTGAQESFAVDRSTPGGQRPLRLAGSPAFRKLRGSYPPRDPCCDLYSYRLTVVYRGGGHKTVTTVQGAAAPRVLWDVIGSVERVGACPLSPMPATAPRGTHDSGPPPPRKEERGRC